MQNLNKIKIAPDSIYEIGQDKVGYFPGWSVKDDATLYEKVRKLRHSTFCGTQASDASPLDPKKFTVVGSPNITDDGIASGFSVYTDRIAVPNTLPSVTTSDKWTFECEFTLPKVNPNRIEIPVRFPYGAYGFINVDGINNTIFVQPYGTVINQISGSNNFSWGSTYNIKIIFDGTNVTVKPQKDGVDLQSSTNPVPSTPVTLDLKYLSLGTYGADNVTYKSFSGSIDLKQFSITVDGVEVFSGNKTGIDTIKPDDYTVVGTPTISADGIASGFSFSNDYLEKSLNKSINNELTILATFTTPSSVGESNYYRFTNTGDRINFGTFSGGQFIVYVGNGFYYDNSNICQPNTTYYVEIKYNKQNNTVKAKYGSNPNNLVDFHTLTPVNAITAINTIQIGKADNAGSIDLNAFKIYVNGDLVYQPCLKIPYTEAELNQKVVDVAYRDRVQDLFEQVGYNGYHTIDEASKNFTLPTHRFDDVIYHKEAGSLVAEQTVGQTLRQEGICTSGTAVTLPIPYGDDTYTLSVATSAKSSTGFTPSESGYWYAYGKAVI